MGTTVSSGTRTSLTIGNGDLLSVFSSGIANDTTIDSGGAAYVSASGLMSGTTLESGGSLFVRRGGSAYDTVQFGGLTEILSGGSASGGVVLGGTLEVYSGGSATNLIYGGGLDPTVVVESGTTVSGLGGDAFGFLIVSAGGSAVDTNNFGLETVLSGGLGLSETVFEATEEVSSGGSAQGNTVSAGGLELVDSGGSATAITVKAGGLLALLSGGSTTGVNLAGGAETSGQSVILYGPGLLESWTNSASGVSVGNLDTLAVLSGGTADSVTVADGRLYDIDGSVSGAAINGYGLAYVEGSGVLSGATVYGGITVASGAKAVNITVSGGSLYALSGATVDVLYIAGGQAGVAQGATLAGTIDFLNGDGEIALDGSTFTPFPIGGMSWGTQVYLPNIPATYSGPLTYDAATTALTIPEGGHVYTLDFYDDSAIDSGGFEAVASAGGTYIELMCFLAGTRIATPHGETPVETLKIGDAVRLADGRPAPVRWVGRQTVSRRLVDPVRTLPVRIRAGALGHGLPQRDLLVSPGHALLLDGLLVQAGALAGLPGIGREPSVPDPLIYWHIELDTPALLLAEGVAAESFVPGIEAGTFDNWAARRALPEPLPLPYPRVRSARQLPTTLRARWARAA